MTGSAFGSVHKSTQGSRLFLFCYWFAQYRLQTSFKVIGPSWPTKRCHSWHPSDRHERRTLVVGFPWSCI